MGFFVKLTPGSFVGDGRLRRRYGSAAAATEPDGDVRPLPHVYATRHVHRYHRRTGCVRRRRDRGSDADGDRRTPGVGVRQGPRRLRDGALPRRPRQAARLSGLKFWSRLLADGVDPRPWRGTSGAAPSTGRSCTGPRRPRSRSSARTPTPCTTVSAPFGCICPRRRDP